MYAEPMQEHLSQALVMTREVGSLWHMRASVAIIAVITTTNDLFWKV